MNLHLLNEYWEVMDIIKTLLSLIVGFILGYEREQKDKAAGLKTISIICLGSTLFTLLSYKMGVGESEDSTRIASYVVSGIGFLGAGVIFKDGFSINGLTTASIIWVAAAIGMAIGFGEFFIALSFLIASLIIIHLGGFINKRFFSKITMKNLEVSMQKNNFEHKELFLDELKLYCSKVEIKRLESNRDNFKMFIELKVFSNKQTELENFLIQKEYIERFIV